MNMNSHKTCKKCGKEKPITAFSKQTLTNAQGEHYRQNICSACKSRAYRERHPEKAPQYAKNWKDRNPERAKKIQRDKAVYRCQRSAWKKEELMKHIGQTCCKECGFSDIRALSFHHRKPEEKKFGIARGLTLNYPLERLKKEAEKCDILCLNCHAIDLSLLKWGGDRPGQSTRNGRK